MNERIAPRSLADLIRQKEKLMRKREHHPELAAELSANIADLDHKIAARLENSNQKFAMNFYKASREALPPEVVAKLENIATTRTHQHRKGN